MSNVWSAIEEIPDLAAVSEDWRRWCGDEFEAFRKAFLDKTRRTASVYPCPGDCQTPHRLKRRDNETFVALCDCPEEMDCEDFTVSEEEAMLWELNVSRLGRAIAWAFECMPMEALLLVPHTRQVASFSSASVPVFLVLPHDRDEFQQVITTMVADSRMKFILVGPTNRFVDARCKELLDKCHSEFFDLASHTVLTADGKLEAARPAKELFARFLPGDKSRRPEVERSMPRFVFRQAGDRCEVVFDGSTVFHINNTDGVKYLDYLLHHPNQPIRAFDLEVTVKPEKTAVRAGNSIQKAVDAKTKREALQELVELKAELEEAEARNDTIKAARIQKEISTLKDVVEGDELLDADTGEKARNNVRKAISKIVGKLRKGGKSEKLFGQHIAQFMSLGYEVSYNQPEGNAWG